MLLLAFLVPRASAEAPIRPLEPRNFSKVELIAYAEKEAVKADLSPTEVVSVIDCETSGTWNPEIQSDAYNKKDGGRELSFGLAQIHLPAHPEITKEQATDPLWAIDYLVRQVAQGRGNMWTCYHEK